MDPWDDETVQDAVAVLQHLVMWTHGPQRWEEVDLAMVELRAAFEAGDADAVRAAIAELDRLGPDRILRIGSRTATGIPTPVLDRRNTLVHWLTRHREEDDRGRRQPR
ncbi:hypothetical protein Aab01nite_01940 [Paractinoplanes abujensis]|uniref:CATRA-Associated Small Protein domain-containing protein n=1 Tax=Paractinoplanes abujensis TaxID=882441 RepID=A0A7W7CNT6_9ACTN|nr:CATRA system-associated protein [Actinoplanes abujensis]MBB4691978.1 hypothetical protein [Actinoplanes abujensis]GID16604.1 hypothetical protein Aab01nite_01940 [Actinoplanes abujensis]